MKNANEPEKDGEQAELPEPKLEQTDGGLIGNSGLDLKTKLADPRPSPIFEVEL